MGRPPRQERMSSPARMATSHLSSASARIAWLAGILLIAALISTMEAAERKSGSSWVSNPVSIAVRSPLARRQAFEQRGVNQPIFHGHVQSLSVFGLKIDIEVMRKGQEGLPEFRGVRRVVRLVGSFDGLYTLRGRGGL